MASLNQGTSLLRFFMQFFNEKGGSRTNYALAVFVPTADLDEIYIYETLVLASNKNSC